MIVRLKMEGFGCVKKVGLPLTNIHALVGPNESGKSSLLRGAWLVGKLAHIALHPEAAADLLPLLPVDPAVPFRMQAELANRLTFEVVFEKGAFTCKVHTGGTSKKHTVLTLARGKRRGKSNGPSPKELWLVLHQMADAAYHRLSADALREPSSLIPHGEPIRFDELGRGMPSVYDALLARGDRAFFDITERLRAHHPLLKSLRVPARTASTKGLTVELQDGSLVDAERLGDGLLFHLAYEALQHTDRPSLLLIEEPERSLHPGTIREVMRIVRAIAEDKGRPSQVLLTTHSPLVLNELRPHEVTLCTRDARFGTRTMPLTATAEFESAPAPENMGGLWLRMQQQLDSAGTLLTPPVA